MRRTRLLLLAPLLVFAALAGVFAYRVNDGADRSVVPSALIDAPAPAVTLPPLAGGAPGIVPDMFEGRVTLLNVFASWCAPCRVEHPLLMEIAGTPDLQLVGLNYKDKAPAAQAFLAELGNPYDVVGVDADGRAGIEWGVYGVPETFIVGPDGTIRAKHVGPLDEAAMTGSFGQTLRGLLAQQAPAGS